MSQESGGLFMLGCVHKVPMRTHIVFVVCFIAWLCTLTEGTKCYKNDDIGEVDDNIYYCNDEGKDECCEEDQEFTCCEPTSKKTLKEQLILWGCVAAAALIISLACLYFWKDMNCLREDTRFCKHCKCCRRKVDEKPLTTIPERPSTSFTRWQPSFQNSRGQDRDDTTATPPPFYYKNPSYKKY